MSQEFTPSRRNNYDEEGNPLKPNSVERPLDSDLREGKVIPPVELLYRDPKALGGVC